VALTLVNPIVDTNRIFFEFVKEFFLRQVRSRVCECPLGLGLGFSLVWLVSDSSLVGLFI